LLLQKEAVATRSAQVKQRERQEKIARRKADAKAKAQLEQDTDDKQDADVDESDPIDDSFHSDIQHPHDSDPIDDAPSDSQNIEPRDTQISSSTVAPTPPSNQLTNVRRSQSTEPRISSRPPSAVSS
jgi:hypothetical protein